MGELVTCSPILNARLTPLLFKSSWLKAKGLISFFLLVFISSIYDSLQEASTQPQKCQEWAPVLVLTFTQRWAGSL